MLQCWKNPRISEEILPTLESHEVNFYGCFPLLPFCEPEDIFPLVVYQLWEEADDSKHKSEIFCDSFVWYGDLCDRG